jgi:hypothetical protein
VKLRKPSRLGVDQIEMSFGVGVGQLKKERYPATAGIDPATPKRLCAQLRQTVIMKRPYRDVLVWLADIRPPIHDLAAERAVAAVIAMLAAYDRGKDWPRWEERFANARNPFGISLKYRELLRTYFTE